MKNKEIKIKSVYNVLENEIAKEWTFKTIPKVGIPIEVPAIFFPESINIDLEELQELLQELDDMGLINFDGIIKEKKVRPYPSEAHSIAIPIFKIWFLPCINAEEIIKEGAVVNKKIKFLEEKAQIKYGGKTCSLPPYRNEYYLCKMMFEYPAHEPVSWDLIYDRMQGTDIEDPSAKKDKWRVVYDAVRAINGRLKETIGLKNNLFEWQDRTVRRKYQ